MAEDKIEKTLEQDNESPQGDGHLLEDFLNRADFENTFHKDIPDAVVSQFPSSDEMLAQAGPTDRGGGTAADARAGGVEARRPRVADRGSDAAPDARAEGAEEKKPKVEKNADGDVTKVTYPNGDTKEFEYDAKHQLTKFKYKNGDYYAKDGNDNWVLHSKHASDSLGKATIRVEKDGTLVFWSQDGNHGMITRPDGRIGKVELENGRVKEIDYPGPDRREFEYDKDGLSKVKEKDGSYWQKGDGGTWTLHDPNGKPTGATMGKIEIDETGDLTMTSVDGKKETIIMPNGTIYRKENGRVSRIEKM